MARELFVKVPWGKVFTKNWHLPAGDSASKKILLLHGNSDHVHCWDWAAEKMSKDWSVVGFDFPGHGQSNMPENLYAPSKDLFGYSLRYVVDELKWDKFHIVAHSMGTFIAAPYACLFPDQVETLTLVDFPGLQSIRPQIMAKYSAMSIENRFDRWMNDRDRNETVGKSYEDYKKALRNTPNNWFTDEKVIEKWLKDGLRKLDDGTFKSRVHPFIRQWGTAHWSLSTEEAYELTKNFDSDLMYLKAREETPKPKNFDKFIDSETQQNYLLELAKNANYYEHHILDGNHLLHMTNSQGTAEKVINFIERKSQSTKEDPDYSFLSQMDDISRI